MNLKHVSFAVAASLVVLPASANAATIVDLVNTGVEILENGGQPIDANWTIGGAAAYTTVNGTFPLAGNWLVNTSTSGWLTPANNQATSFDPTVAGIRNYSINFSLAGLDSSTASFSGRFLVDNLVDSILLNGTKIVGSGGNFTSWTNFNSTGGTFLAGNNTLTFVTRNLAQNGGNPQGLRVEFLSTFAAVPEPTTWAMFLLGFGLVGFSMRRRTGTSTRIAFA